MRTYALMLGILLTTGYGYAAQVAVSSATLRPTDPAPAAGAVEQGPLYYGGMIDPIVVESAPVGSGAKAEVSQRRLLGRPTLRCVDTARPPRYRTVVS
jgi:L-alanine-DL-glutamate epimerase-like enolase superfamily enzyme